MAGNEAVAKAFEDISAAIAVLQTEVGGHRSCPESDDDPLAFLADDCLEILAGTRKAEAELAGLKARAAVVYADSARAAAPPDAPVQALEMSVAAEIGSLLALGGRAAGAFLAASHAVTGTLPLTMAGLRDGSLTWQHAMVLVDETASLDPGGAAALEAHFLDPNAQDAAKGCAAGEMPAHRFKAKARIWRERHHRESLESRHARSVEERRVEFQPDRDGMAWISAYLPADQAAAIWNRLTAVARGLQGPEEARTLTQLRADLYGSWLHGGGVTEGTSPRAQVLVTVPVFSLMGVTGEAALLDGYGPIPPSMARQLVANGASSFHRVLVDPRDGAPLEIGRTSYRLTKAMRNWLRLRDGKCPFPGCSNQSLDNEADHLLAWDRGGTTGVSNLGQPCRKHHRLRHSSAWKPTPATRNEPPGWISPSGRPYKSEHQDWEPPHWPAWLEQGSGPWRQEHLLADGQDSNHFPETCWEVRHPGRSPGEDGLARLLALRAG
ncbi:DUF222 domain-containing protein [Pseudarthrobacter sp. J64]|uniref:HNH endonuclease signature motif containing protein n=1 Tax=Pseudarthrobacter sp. J64 TaxID=3116485 RepID=UPI002E804777|nr:DUF222 domain-containing protein [Pseudarthrobacter sp. J64]MEE2570632.1 DUF222 domain-containing protein [Pseudarthrobacter sp. J64]